MPSELQRLRIANICYANVSSSFALFCNPEMRGPNFRWGNFTSMMLRECWSWLFLNNITRNRQEMQKLASEYTKEIADRLVHHSGFLAYEDLSDSVEKLQAE